jgi:Flp pilus assembly protein TadD
MGIRFKPSRNLTEEGAITIKNGGHAHLGGALADCDRAIELSPKSFIPYINRGIVRRKMGDTYGSHSDFSKAIELNPNAQKLIDAKGYSIVQ